MPKPRLSLSDYAAARTLETVLEALIALEFLERGYTRNAAGKAFQAWRALTGALLALDEDEVIKGLTKGEQERWLMEKAIPRVPSSRLKQLSQLLERAGITYYSSLTDKALNLHDYQYHEPDPDLELSKYRDPAEAEYDILTLLTELNKIITERIKTKLQRLGKWSKDHEEGTRKLQEKLATHH